MCSSDLLRMAALEDRFIGIDQANVFFSEWPGPSSAYFYGGRFHIWLAENFGREAVKELHQLNAANPFPYLYWFSAKFAFGHSLPDLWERFRVDTKVWAEEVRDGVLAQGVTPSKRLSFHGRNITGARYDPSGKFIIYSRSSPVDGSTVRRMERDGSDDHHLVLQTFKIGRAHV